MLRAIVFTTIMSQGTNAEGLDPQVKVKVPGQEAICFEITDESMSIIDLLSDPVRRCF